MRTAAKSASFQFGCTDYKAQLLIHTLPFSFSILRAEREIRRRCAQRQSRHLNVPSVSLSHNKYRAYAHAHTQHTPTQDPFLKATRTFTCHPLRLLLATLPQKRVRKREVVEMGSIGEMLQGVSRPLLMYDMVMVVAKRWRGGGGAG